MRLAAQVTLAAYQAAYLAVKDGMTQPRLCTLVEKAHERLGFTGGADVQVGEFSAFPHGSVTPQVMREGTIVLMDGGCAVEGYQSDITRTFVLGKATDKMNKVFDIVHARAVCGAGAARPGAECGSVDAAARKVVTDGRYGPDYKYFTHRLGHGMGMDGHEWPYLVRGNPTKLRANMTTSNEPGIYIRGEFGIRIEDDMHITENGAELFTPQSRVVGRSVRQGMMTQVVVFYNVWRCLRFRNRRAAGKLLEERVPDVAQILDADFAGEETIGGEFAQE